MKYNTRFLVELNDIINSNVDCFSKKKKKVKSNRNNKGYTYQYYNQLCASIIRVRETINYLEQFEFKGVNTCGQAFDFYEYINCVSIIEGCLESIFKIFDLKLNTYYNQKKVFKISNMTGSSDIDFFKFIRSASSMHPSETTCHNRITKHKFEVYPYAIWCDAMTELFFKEKKKGANIELLSWNCKSNGIYKRYFLSTNEFDDFINELLINLRELLPIVNDVVNKHKEKIRCKCLKSPDQFDNWKDYCLYLRKRIHNKLTDYEFPDGGLLLASHILSNKLIDNDFKKYIKSRVNKIAKKMIIDITEIFDNLSLYNLIGNFDHGGYVAEKFHDYLYKEAIFEIEDENYITFKDKIRFEKDNTKYSNAEWSVIKLLEFKDYLYFNDELVKANSYADLYELTLQVIYKYNKIKI